MSNQNKVSSGTSSSVDAELIAKLLTALLAARKTPENGNSSVEGVLNALSQNGSSQEAAASVQSETSGPADAELTSVNRALGTTVGKALNGKKTWLGSVGLLATTLVPILFPAATPFVEILKSVGLAAGSTADTTNPLIPIFSALTGWGLLGKIEKWTLLK